MQEPRLQQREAQLVYKELHAAGSTVHPKLRSPPAKIDIVLEKVLITMMCSYSSSDTLHS